MNEKDEMMQIAKELFNIRIGNLLVQMYYPNILQFFLARAGIEEMEKTMVKLGKQIGQKILNIWAPKTKSFEKLITGFYKKIWDHKVKIIKKKSKSNITYRILDKECRFCDPEVVIEGVKHPCMTVIGYFQACVEYLSNISPLVVTQSQTVKSVGSGDRYCEYQIEVAR